LHWATEPYGPDGVYGQYLTYMLVAVPLGWLLLAMLTGSNRAPVRSAVPGKAA
jgi:high-affinity iron transporter